MKLYQSTWEMKEGCETSVGTIGVYKTVEDAERAINTFLVGCDDCNDDITCHIEEIEL